MIKKRVIGFFAILLIASATLMLIQTYQFGSLTGYINIKNVTEENIINSDFLLKISDHEIMEDNIKIIYEIKELKGINQEIKSHYTISNQQGKLISQATEEIIIEPNSHRYYIAVLGLPKEVSGKISASIQASNGKQTKFTKRLILLESKSITGYSILKDQKNMNLIILIISTLFIILILDYLYKHHIKIEKLAPHPAGLQKRYISLDIKDLKSS